MKTLLAGFLLDRQIRGLSKGTIEYYRFELELFRKFLHIVGVNHIEAITPELLRNYLEKLSVTRNLGGISASYRAIRAYLNWYGEEFEPEDWKNPIKKVKAPKINKQPLPGIDVGDVIRLVDVCNMQRDRAIFLFLLDTGLRASELLALNIEDLNLTIGAVDVKQGKGNKRRVVFLGRKTRKAVRSYLRERKEQQPHDPLWLTDDGDRLSYYGLTRMIQRRSKNAKIPAPSPHDFRRCYAVTMLRNGCDLARLADLMGHSSFEILRRYLHLVTDDLAAAHAQSGPVDRL